MEILRGDIVYVSSNNKIPPVGSEMWSDRPAIVISNNTGNKHSPVIQVVYLTTAFNKKVSPLHVRIHLNKKPNIALCEQIHSVDRSRVESKLGQVSDKELRELDQAIMFSLGIDEKSYKGLFHKWENYINKYGLQVVEEQELLRENSRDEAIKTLREQINLLTKERDGYKTLLEVTEKRIDEILDCKDPLKV